LSLSHLIYLSLLIILLTFSYILLLSFSTLSIAFVSFLPLYFFNVTLSFYFPFIVCSTLQSVFDSSLSLYLSLLCILPSDSSVFIPCFPCLSTSHPLISFFLNHFPGCLLYSLSSCLILLLCSPIIQSLSLCWTLQLCVSHFISLSSLLPYLSLLCAFSSDSSPVFCLNVLLLSLSVCVLPLSLTPSRWFALCSYPSHPIWFLPLAILQLLFFSSLFSHSINDR
jgi:hypothetical protein